jgi:uncharacterized SAM-binding protein YcdF (DUF218 family)
MIYIFLKNFIGKLLLPTSLLGAIFLVGFILLRKKKEFLKYQYIFICFWFFLIGCNPLVDFTLDKYENIHPRFQESSVKGKVNFVVVLGGGLDFTPTQPLSSQLGPATSIRLLEGIRIHRLYPESKLVLTGHGGYPELTEAAAMASMAIALGVNKDDIIQDPLSENTFEHTQNLKNILMGESFILVTSALHMNRSMLLFEHQQLRPIPAPTQFLLKGHYQGFLTNPRVLPTGDNFHAMDQLTYEWLSLLYGKFKGYF